MLKMLPLPPYNNCRHLLLLAALSFFSSWRGHNQSKRCYAKTETTVWPSAILSVEVNSLEVTHGMFLAKTSKSKGAQLWMLMRLYLDISFQVQGDYDQKTISHYLKAYKLKYKLVKHIEQWLKIMPPVSSRLCTVLMLT